MLAGSPALTELRLRFDVSNAMCGDASKIWDLNLPGLAVLSLENLLLSRTTFCSFLDRHVHLRELTLYSVEERGGFWKRIFRSIRDHPGLEDLEIACLDGGRPRDILSTLSRPKDSVLELYEYLHGRGEWTARLLREWGSL